MDAFLNFMTADTTIFGLSIHNWMLGLAGVVILWVAVVVQDLRTQDFREKRHLIPYRLLSHFFIWPIGPIGRSLAPMVTFNARPLFVPLGL